MKDITVTDSILYIGVDDKDLDLFESQYIIPNGVSYNSYVIMDEKIAVMDTVDARKAEEWLDNLDKALAGRTPDYLVVSHMEPDHAANIKKLVEKYPEMNKKQVQSGEMTDTDFENWMFQEVSKFEDFLSSHP